MSTFGPFPFRIGGHGNPPDGTLTLTYTSPVPPSLSINPASFTYTNVGQPQTYTVTFAAPVNGVYNGTSTMQPPLNIPGSGAYVSGTFVFNPTAGTLTGTFTRPNGIIEPVFDVVISWESDSTSGAENKPQAATSGNY